MKLKIISITKALTSFGRSVFPFKNDPPSTGKQNYENVISGSKIQSLGTRMSKGRGVFSFEISQLDTIAPKGYTNYTRLGRTRALLLGCQTYYRLFVMKVIYGPWVG